MKNRKTTGRFRMLQNISSKTIYSHTACVALAATVLIFAGCDMNGTGQSWAGQNNQPTKNVVASSINSKAADAVKGSSGNAAAEQSHASDNANTGAKHENTAQKSGMNEYELKIWNDPAFQKTFAESYLSQVEIEPRVTPSERTTMLRVMEDISSDKMDKAIAVLERSRDVTASAVFDFTLGNIYFQQEKFEQAAQAYQVAVEKFPKFQRAWRNLGLIYIRDGKFDKAITALTRVIELGGCDSLVYGLLGYAYSSTENHLAAESAYRLAILLDPVTLDWKKGLARSLFKQQRYAEAVSLCSNLIAEYPENAELWLLQANAYIRLNQPLKAAENYEFVESLGKSTPESLNMLGDIYINEEFYEMAVKSYIKAMSLNPKGNIDRMIRAAKVLTARGANDETKKIIEFIEKQRGKNLVNGERKEVLKIKARLAVSQGAGEEEADVLKEIVEIDPLDGEALILLGQYSSRKGDNEKAIFYYQRAANIEKYEADAKVRHAQLLVTQSKYAEALPLLRRAQQINPRDNIQKYLEQVERISKTK